MLRDMPVARQLRVGLALVLAPVLALGALAWWQSDILWRQTETIYDHPLQVRRAISRLHIDILTLRLEFRNLLLADNEEARRAAVGHTAEGIADAERQFDLLYQRYLGSRADIDEAKQAFDHWIALRQDNVQLATRGEVAAALARLDPHTGDVGRQGGVLEAHIGHMDVFAGAKAEELFRLATEQKAVLTRRLIVTVVAILLMSFVAAALLLRSLRQPLARLTSAADAFRGGDFGARVGYESANEFGQLSSSFDAMARAVDLQMRTTADAAHVGDVMAREAPPTVFCHDVLLALADVTRAQVAAIYLRNPQKTAFELFSSIGLDAGGRAAFSATAPEGEFGAALATGRIQRVSAGPAGERFVFQAAAGPISARDILTIPILANGEPLAVVSLASVAGFDEHALRVVEHVHATLAARLDGVLAFRQIREQAERLDQQNRQLQAQKLELVAQSQELSAQKQELTAQSQELTSQNTELEIQARQLGEASRLKSAFLSNMSHELRTPLNSVIALSGVLSRRLKRVIPDEEYGYLEVIERNGRHLLSLINAILDLSRIEAGREEVAHESFSLHEVVGDVVSMLRPQAGEKGIALVNHVPEDLPALASDRDKVGHVLQNLVGNAVKFTEAGTVDVRACVVDGEFRIDVQDTGIGIAEGQLPYIFEEFRQADESTSRKYGGTGLGLAIASRYASLLGGRITVESAPGAGSTFTLWVPRAHAPGHVVHAVPMSPAVVEAARPPRAQGDALSRVLVVDDDEAAVVQLRDILQSEGYAVDVASDGRDVIARVEQVRPDAVILDLNLPGMHGVDVLRALRETPGTAGLPVLVLTASSLPGEELGALRARGIHDLLQKGDVNRAALLGAVARMVAREPAPSPASPAPRVARQRSAPGNPVILVIEDNADNLQTLRALLAGLGEVVTAADGRAGIEQARRRRPDVVLTDLALPLVDGFGVLSAIRSDEALADVPVVAVTASAMKGDREAILARGFDGYVSKPIDVHALHRTLDEALRGPEPADRSRD